MELLLFTLKNKKIKKHEFQIKWTKNKNAKQYEILQSFFKKYKIKQ